LGDNGDYLFVIEKGTLECRKEINGVDTLLKTVEEGDVFGELALLYNTVRAANVEAKADCLLWKLDRSSFTHIVKDAAQKKRERYEGFLSSVPLLRDNGMDNYGRSQICDGLHNESFVAGEVVITEGEEGKKFYIVESGTFTGIKKGMEPYTYQPGDFFGERALLRDEPRAATVNAVTDGELLVLDRGAFKRLFSGSEKLMEAMGRQTVKYESADEK
jgi:cAMP-dependent protein kinase regulator